MSWQGPRLTGQAPAQIAGACRRCGVVHTIDNDVDTAVAVLQSTFDELASPTTTEGARDREVLLGTRGKMLAVLVGVDVDGQQRALLAYSGDLGGPQDRSGWAPSIIRREHTAVLEATTLITIAALTTQLETARAADDVLGVERCRRARKQASATLMMAMHDAVQLTSPAGVTLPLRDVFMPASVGMPSGTADCGLPKLLHAANTAGWRVVGTAEAWWGPDLGDRRHGVLQAPCVPKCQPILGHLLCPAAATT